MEEGRLLKVVKISIDRHEAARRQRGPRSRTAVFVQARLAVKERDMRCVLRDRLELTERQLQDVRQPTAGNTKGYSSTYLAMGFANVRAGT